MTTIRHLAVSADGTLLAAAEFESVVHLWDLKSPTWLRTFETTLDFGGHRIGVSPDGNLVAIGAYQRHGVAVYRATNGSELWRRKDLKKVQQLQFDRGGERLWCCFDQRPCEQLDTTNGESGPKLRGVRKAWLSGFGPARLFQLRKNYMIENRESRLTIPRASFAVLSAAFSKSEVCISEAAGPVRLYNFERGAEIWRLNPPGGTHFLIVAHHVSTDKFVGISWPFEKGGAMTLCSFDRNTGGPIPLAETAPSQCIFSADGSRLFTADGAIVNVASGRIETTLDFPFKAPSNRLQG